MNPHVVAPASVASAAGESSTPLADGLFRFLERLESGGIKVSLEEAVHAYWDSARELPMRARPEVKPDMAGESGLLESACRQLEFLGIMKACCELTGVRFIDVDLDAMIADAESERERAAERARVAEKVTSVATDLNLWATRTSEAAYEKLASQRRCAVAANVVRRQGDRTQARTQMRNRARRSTRRVVGRTTARAKNGDPSGEPPPAPSLSRLVADVARSGSLIGGAR